MGSTPILASKTLQAGVAQLVERNLAKVEVESSRLLSRSSIQEGQLRVAALFAFMAPRGVKRARGPFAHETLELAQGHSVRLSGDQ
jgi:hypothetical protein